MSWLMHNVVADMYGPYFLAFYATVIVVVIVACFISIRSIDRTRSLEPPAIPAKLDPYEVAYLRGGENEVARVAIASLIQRGLLQIIEERTFLSKPKRMNRVGCGGSSGRRRTTFLSKTRKVDRGRKPIANELRPIEALVLKWSGFPTDPRSIFAADGIPTLLEESCFPFKEALTEKNLLAPKEMKAVGVLVWLAGSALILGLGGYKLWVALAKGHTNVAFLCILGLLGVVFLAVVCMGLLPRISLLGKAYLERLKLAYGGLKDPFQLGDVRDIAGELGEREKAQAARAYSDALVMLGIFGLDVLCLTSLSDLNTMFARGASSGGGCGGACGGGGGRGGGGGCGGGGCGGCGG